MEETELHTILTQAAGQRPNVKQTSIIDEGSSFISKVFAVDVTWEESRFPEKMVVKIPTATLAEKPDDKENMSKKKQGIIRRVHNIECFCYEVFQKHSELFSRMKTPAIYSISRNAEREPGHILMEDLNQNYAMANFAIGLELDQIYKLVDALVELHIFSFLHPELVEMLQAFPVYAYKWFPFHVDEIVKGLEEHHRDVYRLSRKKIDKIFNFSVVENIAQYSGPKVFAHGSMWAHNLFLSQAGDRDPVIIDWQLAHHGSPSEDLARLLTSTMTPEMRRQNEPEIIEYYLKELKSKAEDAGVAPTFSDEQFLEQYLDNFPFCAAMLLGQTGLLLMHNQKKATHFRENELLIRAIAVCMDALNIA